MRNLLLALALVGSPMAWAQMDTTAVAVESGFGIEPVENRADPSAKPVIPKAHMVDMGFDDSVKSPGMDLILSHVGNARLVFTGENHSYSKFNSMLEYVMMRNLYEQKGFNRFLIELSPARAHYMNRYICDGDTMALAVLRSMTGYRYMDMFRAMRGWMKDIPAEKQIRIVGIDVERFTDLPMLRLHELLPKTGIPDELKSFVESLHQMGAMALDKGQVEYRTESLPHLQGLEGDDDYECTLSELVTRYADSLDGAMRTWLGSEYAGYAEAMGWLKQYERWEELDDMAQQYAWREEHMYQTLKGALSAEPESKFFGQFGRCHIGLTPQQQDCGWFEYHSVVNRISERYFKSDSMVLSIGVFYRDEMDAISTNDPTKRQAIRDEILSLTGYEEPETYVFDIRDTSAQLPLLADKFHLALLHSEQVEGLEVDTSLDASYYGDDEYDYNEDSESSSWVIFEPLGFGTLGADYSAMATHFEGLSKPFENVPTPIYYQFAFAYRAEHLGLRLEQGLYAMPVYSGIDGNLKLGTNTTSLQGFADFHLGNKWVISPSVGVGQLTDKLHWSPISSSILNPDPRGMVSVVAHQNYWISSLSVGFEPVEEIRLSVYAGMQQALNINDRSGRLQYYYKGTLTPYLAPDALGTPLNGMGFGFRLEFLIDAAPDDYSYDWEDGL